MEKDVTYLQVNNKTGEVTVPEGRFFTQQQLDANRQYREKKAISEEKIKLQNDYGTFVFLLFDYKKELFPNISGANLTRLMFLSTFLNYDGFLAHDNRRAISKKNVASLLNLTQSTFKRFWLQMTENEILKEENGLIYLNSAIFNKGKTDRLDSAMTRICVEGVRSLFEIADVKSHKTLSYVFKILPFINIQYNIACHNPQETDINKIQHFTLGEFCDMVGYDRSKTKRLMKDLFECTFDGKNAMRYVSDKFDMQTWRIFVNPKIYYAGNNWEKVEILGGF